MHMRKGTPICIKFIVLCISTLRYYFIHDKILIHYDCKIGFLANEWLWFCSCCLGDEMVPYMHVQWAIHPYTLGRLRNDVMEHKHMEMKILNSNQGGGTGVAKEYKNTSEHNKMCHVNEMQA